MKRFSLLLLLPLLGALTACEPTERTNPEAKKHHPAPQPTETPAEVTVPEQTPAPQPETPPQEPAPQPAAPAPAPADAILVVRATGQDYNILLPWQKRRPEQESALGVYLGDNLVLTLAEPLQAATFVELASADESRNVPARVIRRDDDLNLALVTLLHEEDTAIFADRKPLSLGAPLAQGDAAEVGGFVNGLTPFRLSGSVQGSSEVVPHQNLRLSSPLADGNEHGAPAVRDGKLVGLSDGYEDAGQTLHLINAELLERFLAENHQAGTPLLGVQFTELDDPALRHYLELPEGQTGLYVSKVIPGGSAAAAGLAAGDVITAIEGMPIVSRGRVNHPLYGTIDAADALRTLKPLGESVTFTLYRNGEQVQLPVELNRELNNSPLRRELSKDEAPHYILWGGLLFQPLSESYLRALRSEGSRGELPLSFLRLAQQEQQLAEDGIREVVALTLIIPTPATLGYEESRFTVVKAVNGKPVHDFAEFEQLLDEPTEDNITTLSIDRAPYTIHIDRSAAEAANDLLRRRGIPTLRVTEQPQG